MSDGKKEWANEEEDSKEIIDLQRFAQAINLDSCIRDVHDLRELRHKLLVLRHQVYMLDSQTSLCLPKAYWDYIASMKETLSKLGV